MALASFTGRKTFDPVPYVDVLANLDVDVSSEAPDGRTIGVLVRPGAKLPEAAPLDWDGLNSVGFEGEKGQTVPLPVGMGSRLILVGAGDSGLTANTLRDAAAAFSRATLHNAEVGFTLPDDFDPALAAQVVVEGILLARYRYDALKSKVSVPPVTSITLVSSDTDQVTAGARRGVALAEATAIARDLANTPPALLTATQMADVAKRLGVDRGLQVEVRGEDLGLDAIRLNVGDTMLMQGTWDALDRGLMDSPDVLLVDQPSEVRRQAVPMGPGSTRSLVILAGMVVLLATGLVPAVVAAVLAAGALILTRVVNVKQAYRSISWTTVILVGGMIPVSVAVEESGAAEDIAKLLVDVVGDAGPYALLLGIFVITAVFGQLISNTATALIMIPIAITAATDLGISVRPVMMSLSVAAAAAFLTPVATAANLMVMEPAGYRFSDYWKLGGVMLLLFMAASVLLVPVFWSFERRLDGSAK